MKLYIAVREEKAQLQDIGNNVQKALIPLYLFHGLSIDIAYC
jgi:hypothetical protein